jgi:hypothetical protein
MEVPGVGTVYRYQGRANFPHQIAEADRLMTEHCQKVNGGKPVAVSREKVDLGTVSYGSAQANTSGSAVVTGNSNMAVASGSSTTTASGSNTTLRNVNQEILYKCVQ